MRGAAGLPGCEDVARSVPRAERKSGTSNEGSGKANVRRMMTRRALESFEARHPSALMVIHAVES